MTDFYTGKLRLLMYLIGTVILDVQKELDKAICKSLQERENTKDIRLILLTEHELRVPLNCKPHAIIKKPFMPEEMIGTIKRLL